MGDACLRTIAVEADSDLQSLSRLLDRLAVLELRCRTINAHFADGGLCVAIDLDDPSDDRIRLVVAKIAAMPCIRRVEEIGASAAARQCRATTS